MELEHTIVKYKVDGQAICNVETFEDFGLALEECELLNENNENPEVVFYVSSDVKE